MDSRFVVLVAGSILIECQEGKAGSNIRMCVGNEPINRAKDVLVDFGAMLEVGAVGE